MIKDIKELCQAPRTIDLTGPDGNAYVLMENYAKPWAEQLELNWKEIQADMTSGDYEHLLEVFEKHFGSFVTLYR